MTLGMHDTAPLDILYTSHALAQTLREYLDKMVNAAENRRRAYGKLLVTSV